MQQGKNASRPKVRKNKDSDSVEENLGGGPVPDPRSQEAQGSGPGNVEQKEGEEGVQQKPVGSPLTQVFAEEDAKSASRLEKLICKRLYKIERDNMEILKLQMRVQRMRQEIQRMSLKRAEVLTMRLL